MGSVWVIVALWLLFGASHMALSSIPIRARLVSALGRIGFIGLYSGIAFACFVPLVWQYWEHRHAGPLLWSLALGGPVRWLFYLAMALAFVLVAAGLISPAPTSIAARAHAGPPAPRGAHYITRHPLFMGVGLWGALHVLANGFASDVAFFAGFPAFALLGCWHQDRRHLAERGEAYREFMARTSFLPFVGSSALRGLRELSPMAVGLGIAATVLLRTFHDRLTG